jgi:predicted ArsR family transcriptional regulator
MRSESAETSLHTLVPVIAEGRVLDAVAGRDLRGTLDDIADALGVSYNDLRAAIDELTAIGWVTLELMGEALVLSLPEDARAAS